MKKQTHHLALITFTIAVVQLAAQAGPQIEITDLGTLGSNFGQAVAVNESGQAVGRSFTVTGQEHAFSWTKYCSTKERFALAAFCGSLSLPELTY